MLDTEEEPSSAYQRTYSSASEGAMDSVTPNSSYGSMHMKKAFGERFSIDSTSSLYENQTALCDTDISDSDASLNQSQLRSRNSSASSDGSILFSPPFEIPVAPRSLSRVPEHVPLGELVYIVTYHRGSPILNFLCEVYLWCN